MSNSTMLRASKLIRHSSPSSLPDELLFDEILIRLPLLCLVRFKSVSKSWSSYLSTPKFMAAYHERHHRSLDTSLVFELYKNRSEIHHYTYNINDNTLFTQITNLDLPAMLVTTLTRTNNNNNNNKYYNSRLSRSSLKKKKEVQSYEVVGYCDGIMCCLLPVNRTDTDPYTEKMILWDLTLGKTTLTLPSSYNYFSYGMHGAEDIIFGIGYDNKASHDYKVIRAAILPGETSDTVVVQANVYSLGLNTWTSFEATLPRARVRHGQGVHVNGVLYWSLGNDYCSLLSFCLVNQVFDRVPLLKDMIKQGEHPDDVDVFGRLINLKDRLGMFTQSSMHHLIPTSVALWVMLDSKSWTKLYDINLGIQLQSFRIVKDQILLAKPLHDGRWFVYDSRTNFNKVSVSFKDDDEFDDPRLYRSLLF